jgi:hypothetical protein
MAWRLALFLCAVRQIFRLWTRPPSPLRLTLTFVRIPTKPAMHSNIKPATYSDPKPATIPI